MILNTLIIDDELNACETIVRLIELCKLPLLIKGMAHTVVDAVKLIDDFKPDLIFLDIQLPTGTGFEILDKIQYKNLQVIFVTAHEEYALKAFKYSAVDYLLKPIGRKDLAESIERAIENSKLKNNRAKIENLLLNASSEKRTKLIINTINNYKLIDLNHLMYCESDGSYTHFYMEDDSKITASKTLKVFSEVLDEFGLYRAYRSHYINLKYVASFIKGIKPTVTMRNGKTLEISREKKEELFKLLNT